MLFEDQWSGLDVHGHQTGIASCVDDFSLKRHQRKVERVLGGCFEWEITWEDTTRVLFKMTYRCRWELWMEKLTRRQQCRLKPKAVQWYWILKCCLIRVLQHNALWGLLKKLLYTHRQVLSIVELSQNVLYTYSSFSWASGNSNVATNLLSGNLKTVSCTRLWCGLDYLKPNYTGSDFLSGRTWAGLSVTCGCPWSLTELCPVYASRHRIRETLWYGVKHK